MSSQDPEKLYDNMTDLLRFIFGQSMKEIHTVSVGVVQTYDETTKRATVLPALRTMLTDNTSRDKRPIANVPVIHPSGGGFVVHFPINPGDPVVLLFSSRGLSKFKQVYENTDPDFDGFFSMKDAIALVGFGALNINPATSSGVSVQTESGSDHIFVEEGKIAVSTTGSVNITATNATVTATSVVNISAPGGDVVVSGISLTGHTHTGDSGGTTGPPNP